MFDSAPDNLPIVPTVKAAPPVSTAPTGMPPRSAQPIDVPGNREPEDIFSDIQDPSNTSQAMFSPTPLPPTGGGFPWKFVIGVGIPLVVVALGVGGWYIWRSYQPVGTVPESVKQTTASPTVTSSAEPGDESQIMDNPMPVPDENRAAASQTSLALLQGQAQQASGTSDIPEMPTTNATTSDGQDQQTSQTDAGQEPSSGEAQENVANIPEPTGVNGGAAVLAVGIDSDADGLTNSEEMLLGTNPEVKDTNGNGYEDGAEVRNGYDPLVRGVKLVTSGSLKKEAIGNLELLMPSVWTRKASAGGVNLIQTGTPATFSISMEPFASPMALPDWLIAKYPGSATQDYVAQKTAANADVVYSKDGLTAWLLMGNTVYILRYAPNGASALDFRALFSVLVQQARMMP